MGTLQNPQQEQFAQLLAKGVIVPEAYLKSVGRDGASRDSADSNAWAYLKKNEHITVRKAEIQALTSERVAKRHDMTKDEAISLLVQAIRQKPKHASENSRVCEVKMSKAGQYYATVSKIEAFRLLGQWCGWNAPVKIDGAGEIGEALSGWLAKIRQSHKVIDVDTQSQDVGTPALEDVSFDCD